MTLFWLCIFEFYFGQSLAGIKVYSHFCLAAQTGACVCVCVCEQVGRVAFNCHDGPFAWFHVTHFLAYLLKN